jgi:hypothetical protein
MKKKGTRQVVLAEKICVGAKQSVFMDYLAEDLYGIESLELVHISGKVTCYNENSKSTFGCGDWGYMMMATKNGQIMFPDFDK